MTLELRAVETEEEWSALHDIRRRVLFAPGRSRTTIEYDPNHPDDRAPDNVPHILMQDERPVGVARLDLGDHLAVVRLVAIEPCVQRQGLGRMMDSMLAEKAFELGARELRVNAAPDAVGFYEKCGWHCEEWDREELVGLALDCVQMVKRL